MKSLVHSIKTARVNNKLPQGLALLFSTAFAVNCQSAINVVDPATNSEVESTEHSNPPDKPGIPPWYPPQGEAELASIGSPRSILLRGFVVTPNQIFTGEVFIQGDLIACVNTSCSNEPGIEEASVVETNGLIFPGLINTTHQTLYGVFDHTAWPNAGNFQNKAEWLKEQNFQTIRAIKQYLNNEEDFPNDSDPMHPIPKVTLGCELEKYGEIKGLIAGTTSMITSATPTNQKCLGSLARTIDQYTNGLSEDKIQTCSTGDIPTSICNNIATGKTTRFLFNAAEGQPGAADTLFDLLEQVPDPKNNAYCTLFAPQTVVVHGVGLEPPQFSIMSNSKMKLVWTPQSDMRLYGKTTDIGQVFSKNIPVALATDWSLTGSQNLFNELRFASEYIKTHWPNLQLSGKRLVQMVTSEAAYVLGVGRDLGSLEKGKKADVLVIGGDRNMPYDSLIKATPASVRLSIVGGVPLYGDKHLLPIAPQDPGCEQLDICASQDSSVAKFICVASTHDDAAKMNQTLSDIQNVLFSDPILSNHVQIAPLVKCE